MWNDKSRFAELRRLAEARLARDGTTPLPESDLELHRILHELEVHAVELELQNEELRKTRDQLERARDGFRDLYDFAPAAYFSLNDEGMIRKANVAASELLSLPPAKLVDRGFLGFVDARDRALFLHRTRSVAKNRTPCSVELRILRAPEDAQLYVRVEISCAQDGGLRLVAMDVSEHKLLEQQRDLFFSVASHELRTPITNIALALELTLDDERERLPPTVREKLAIAHRGAKRLQRLMEDMLELRNLKTSSWPIRVDTIDLAPLVAEAVKLNAPMAEHAGIRLELAPGPGSAWVRASDARILQVMNNLLTNALKFSPANGRVLVSLETRDQRHRVCVRDQGPGVPAHLNEKVFQPFAQGTPSLENGPHRGSKGLGLSIGRQIMHKLGGDINYFNLKEGGAVFYFELPVLVL